MSGRRFLMVAVLGALLLPASAMADSLQFGFAGGLAVVTTGTGTGIISNDPSTPPTQTTPSASTLTTIGTTNLGTVFSGTLGNVIFTTGTATGSVTQNISGLGLRITQVTYGPGGSIAVTSGPGLAPIPNATLFTGFFSGPTVFAPINPITAANPYSMWTLSGLVTTTTLNPTLLALLGLPTLPGGTFSAIQLDVSFRFSGAGIQSGIITLVPEPGTLALAGTGLIALAGLVRLRKKS